MAKTNVYSAKGDVSGTIEVPEVFATPYRPDVIKRSVLAAAANGRQPYGPEKDAGIKHSVSTWGKGRGVSRVQRLKGGRMAAESPNNVSGRRAHPPLPERDWTLKVNKKERALARRSALAATADADRVRDRGHAFDDAVSFPLVISDDAQEIGTAAGVNELFDKIGIGYDLDRAKDGRKIRAGKGKMRNRRYRAPVSILLVVTDREVPIARGANNLPGVQIETVSGLNASVLAPGGDAGRLTVYTESAIKAIEGWAQ
ncbi:MAG: 50S ribosomal protein L4 [Thermoplasmatales archaeon]|nr:50S ribosomal protein L4 [Thermoplasmatales archaeon]